MAVLSMMWRRSGSGMTELQRCEKEIREHEANLRAGHPEVAGLFRALLD